jgi:hypothetical protein
VPFDFVTRPVSLSTDVGAVCLKLWLDSAQCYQRWQTKTIAQTIHDYIHLLKVNLKVTFSLSPVELVLRHELEMRLRFVETDWRLESSAIANPTSGHPYHDNIVRKEHHFHCCGH